MKLEDLYQKLILAYDSKNLNRIALVLIELLKTKQFGVLKSIGEMIDDTFVWDFEKNSKSFAKIMMLYHPDRKELINKQLNEYYQNKNLDGLLDFAHILKLERIEEFAKTIINYEDLDYSPVYEWDINTEGFTIFSNSEASESSVEQEKAKEGPDFFTFYDAIKMRMYGTTDIEFPSYYLEDIDELELSEAGISDLEGAEFCIHTVSLDLSENYITDISPLWNLAKLKELNLSNNKISVIDTLSNLTELQQINLSGNEIEDISALMALPNLNYVDLSGNPISEYQLTELKDSGVKVNFD